MKKIFVTFALVILLTGVVSASLIATIGMQGLEFIHPGLANTVKGIMCVTSPAGLVTCAAQYVEGKIIGFVSGEVLQVIAEASPEAAKAIITYNQVQSYIDKGAKILEDLEVDENGNINKGVIGLSGEEYSLKDFFENLTSEDIIVSNATYDFNSKTITMKEDGFVKIKTKDEEGSVIELVYENIRGGGFFKLSENGTIDEANFSSSKDDSIYKFGDNEEIKVEAGTKIIYKDGKITVGRGGGGNFLYGDTNISLAIPRTYYPSVDISGDKISCERCELKIDEIELSSLPGEPVSLFLNDKGYLIESAGGVIFKQNSLSIWKPVLIANPNADLSDYEGNWLKQTENSLELQTNNDGVIMMDFLEDHKILNIDGRDRVKVVIEKGDGLIFEKRDNRGLIPKITHKSSESGITTFTNGGVIFEFTEKGLSMKRPLRLDLLGIQDEKYKYQSSAVEIESDSPEVNEKLRINAYRQFKILNKNNEEVVTYDKYDLPISTLIEDNKIQTIGQLIEKYPDLEFFVPSRSKITGRENRFMNNENVPPYLLYLTDIFLKENPEAVKYLDKITYSDISDVGMHVYSLETNTMEIGLKAVDPNIEDYLETPPPVKVDYSPLKTLTREYEILLSVIELKDPELEELWNNRIEVQNKISELVERLRKINQDSEEARKIDDVLSSLFNRRSKLEEKIESKYGELGIKTTP